jgi:hypothetical protein
MATRHPRPDPADYAKRLAGRHEHRLISGGIVDADRG